MEMPSALIAMSGGVDSSVAAWLVQQQGYACTGVTMQLHQSGAAQANPARQTCCSQQDIADAAKIAARLGMPYEVLDFTRDFSEKVIEKFIRTYEQGGTPNPCIDCNRQMKFAGLLRVANQRGVDCIATGHYARIEQDPVSRRWLLRKGLDTAKDQSYVLYALTQQQLAHTRLPLGDMHKEAVRQLAEKLDFVNARKRDSQDICFVPDGDYAAFMERYTGKHYPAGDYLNLAGQAVGRHRGAVRYTIGQRKGLALAMGEPVYVCHKDMAANTVTIGPNEALYSKTLLAEDVNWIPFEAPSRPLRVQASTRYHQPPQWATAAITDAGQLRVDFDEPLRAISPGQAVVLYDGEMVLGGGTIVQAL